MRNARRSEGAGRTSSRAALSAAPGVDDCSADSAAAAPRLRCDRPAAAPGAAANAGADAAAAAGGGGGAGVAAGPFAATEA